MNYCTKKQKLKFAPDILALDILEIKNMDSSIRNRYFMLKILFFA